MDGQPEPIGPPQRSGCMVALYVLFGVGLLAFLVGGVSLYFFLQSEQGQQFVKVVRDGAEWITVASQAPGTEELRGEGCETAMVSSASAAFNVFSVFIPEEDKQAELREQLERDAGGYDLDELLLVICALPRFSPQTPQCDQLARTYSSAVADVPDSFYVLAMQQGQDAPSCQGIYAPDGTLLESPEFLAD
jgi:hypothetical protein